MSEVYFNYNCMDDAAAAAAKAAKQCGDYAAELKKNVAVRISGFTGGSSENTTAAFGYVSDKIIRLTEKKGQLERLSSGLRTLKGEACDTDRDVRSMVCTKSRDFRAANDMAVSVVAEFFAGFFTAIANKSPLAKLYKDCYTRGAEWLREKWADIKYWYHCDGGKYIVKTVLSAVALVAAVAAAIVAWPAILAATSVWGTIVAVAGFVSAVIAVADALTDFWYNCKAAATHNEDPAWARRYDSYDSVAGTLNKKRYSSSFLNKKSYELSQKIQLIKTACDFINLANAAQKGVTFLKDFKQNSKLFKRMTNLNGKVDFGALKSNFTTMQKAMSSNVRADAFIGFSPSKLVQYAQKVNSGIKPLKTISKFVDKTMDKGFGSAVHDYVKGKTTVTKGTVGVYKDITSYSKYVKAAA